MGKTKHTGGCHCGAVRVEVMLDVSKGSRCNCTICMKTGITGATMKPNELVVTKGEDIASSYEFGTKSGKRFFCPTCGVHVYGRGHIPEMGGDYAQVNLNTLDNLDLRDVAVTYWDGRHDNWQAGPRVEPYPSATSFA